MSTKHDFPFKRIAVIGVFVFIVLAFFVYGVYLVISPWNFSATPEEEIERINQEIQNAKQKDGHLMLFLPWFGAEREFYATTQFQLLRNQQGIRYLYSCGYVDNPVPKDSVAAIASMLDLEGISFQNTFFEDGAISELNQLPKLKNLQFWGCRFDAESLKSFAEHGQLCSLSILWPFPNEQSDNESHRMPPNEYRELLDAVACLKQLEDLTLQESFCPEEEFLKRELSNTNIVFDDNGFDIP